MSILPYSSGGGGGGYPGVTSDGADGLVIAKGLAVGGAGSSTDPTYQAITGNLQVVSKQGDYLDGDWTLYIEQDASLTGDDLPAGVFVQRSVTRNGHSVTFPAFMVAVLEASGGPLPADEPLAQFTGGGTVLIDTSGNITTTGTISTGVLSSLTTTTLGGGAIETVGAITSGPSQATGTGSTPSVTAKKLAGQTGYLLLCEDDSNALKASIAVDGEFLTTDDVIAFGTINCHHGFAAFNHAIPAVQPAITGALSAVVDPAVKAILTSLIAAVAGCGLASDTTT